VLGAGTVINPIIKIVTTVVILGAIGIFIVRPILDTTNNAIDSVGEQVRNAQHQAQQSSDDFDLNFARDRARGYVTSLQSSWPSAARELKACIAKADTTAQMQHCASLGQRVVTVELGDHNTAVAYASSLEAQGDQAAADKVRECVKDAGIRAAAMNRCRDLADRLLFG
jgi:hypothetical protein